MYATQQFRPSKIKLVHIVEPVQQLPSGHEEKDRRLTTDS